ncbi:MAG TPA: phosphohydrolase, partial [Paludibacteraceae bacterium]|nr:phosphohydrolase [Paludibacteraceae bacterium]
YFKISAEEAEYFMGEETVSTDTYNPSEERINILYKNNTVKDITEASDMLNIKVLTKKVYKHYLCYCRL